jgi:hypothetical protein
MNASVLLMADAARLPRNTVEAHWRRAKAMVRMEGRKSDYMLAWYYTARMCGISPRMISGGKVTYAGDTGTIKSFDASHVVIVYRDGANSIRVPIAAVMLEERL